MQFTKPPFMEVAMPIFVKVSVFFTSFALKFTLLVFKWALKSFAGLAMALVARLVTAPADHSDQGNR